MMLLHGLLSRRLGLGKEFGFFVYGQSGVLSLSVISELLRITNPPLQLLCLNLNAILGHVITALPTSIYFISQLACSNHLLRFLLNRDSYF